jgi:hypothetical protein
MRKSLLQALLPLLIAALFLAVLIGLGGAAREALRGRGSYTVAFADIDCPPPPGQERGDFLGEVQYVGGLPDRLNLLDDGLAERLAGAFAKHPWVEKVERVEIVPPGWVRVQLQCRTPVLYVSPQGIRKWEDAGWYPPAINLAAPVPVDRHGVVLPGRAWKDKQGLPSLFNLNASRPPPAGSPWGDAAVQAAACTADYLGPYQDRLHLEDFEMIDGGLVLNHFFAFRVFWGHAPGEEQAGEAPAAEKVKRLLDYCDQHGTLGTEREWIEHDVRPQDQAIHRPLFPKG